MDRKIAVFVRFANSNNYKERCSGFHLVGPLLLLFPPFIPLSPPSSAFLPPSNDFILSISSDINSLYSHNLTSYISLFSVYLSFLSVIWSIRIVLPHSFLRSPRSTSFLFHLSSSLPCAYTNRNHSCRGETHLPCFKIDSRDHV